MPSIRTTWQYNQKGWNQFDFKNMHLEMALFQWNLTTEFHKVQAKQFLASRLKETTQIGTITSLSVVSGQRGHQPLVHSWLSPCHRSLPIASKGCFWPPSPLPYLTHSLSFVFHVSFSFCGQLLKACLLELFLPLRFLTLHSPLLTM